MKTDTEHERTEKDELENVIAAKIEIEIEIETMSTENGKTINVLEAQNERNVDEEEEDEKMRLYFIKV